MTEEQLPQDIELEQPELETPEETPEPQEPSPFVEIDGQQVPVEEVRRAAAFIDWTTRNPDKWDELQRWERGEAVLTEPKYIDEEDVWEADDDPRYNALQKELQDLKASLQEVGQVTGWREQQAHAQALQSGIATFQEQHPELNEQDWDKLLYSTRDHRFIENYVARDPYNPVAAVHRALEAAYKLEFYDRASSNGATQAVDDLARKRRAAAAATTRASVPRQSEDEDKGTLAGIIRDIKAAQDASNG